MLRLHSIPLATRLSSYGFQLFVVFCALMSLTGRAQVPATLPTLTEAKAILQLSRTEADREYPVRFIAAVTCYEPTLQLFFAQDATAGVYVYIFNPGQTLTVGQWVEIEGVTGAGRFSPIIKYGRLRPLERHGLPPARKIPIEELSTGGYDSQWVEVEGVVRHAREEWGYLTLHVAAGTGRLMVRVLGTKLSSAEDLNDARIRVRGVVGSHFNDKAQLQGFHLFASGTNQIEILTPPRPDPFALPLQNANALLAYRPQGDAGHRVRVEGVVTFQQPGRFLFLRDEAGGIRLQTRQTNLVAVGEVVTAAGYPVPGGYSPLLEDSVFRSTGTQRTASPISLTVKQALSGEYDNQPIMVKAYLRQYGVAHTDHQVLILQSGETVFEAELPDTGDHSRIGPLHEGSELEVTGICRVHVDEEKRISNIRLLLRSSEDIHIVHAAPAAQRARLVWLLGFVVVTIGLGLLWLLVVKRSLQAQVEVLQLQDNLFDTPDTQALKDAPTRNARAFWELVALVFFAIVAFGVAVRTNAFEMIARWTQEHEEWQVDELFTLLILLSVAFGIFSWRRWSELRQEIILRFRVAAQLRERERQLRLALSERERLGRDLHDGIIQSIYAIGLNMDISRRMLKDSPQEVGGRLKSTTEDLNKVIRDVRNFIMGLQPEVLKGQELGTALKSLVLTLNQNHQNNFVLNLDPEASAKLTMPEATQLLHIASEAMSNSARHSQAATTVVSLKSLPGMVRLEVSDNGVGFSPDTLKTTGYGLKNMTARAREIGADVRIDSQPDCGTRIVIDIPKPT